MKLCRLPIAHGSERFPLFEQRDLPRHGAVLAPLPEHVVDLRRVDAARDVTAPVGDPLRQDPEHRRRRDHRRADSDSLRVPDLLRDPRRQRIGETRREPRPHLRAVDLNGSRLDEAAPLDVTVPPQLLEVQRERRCKLGGVDGDDHVLLSRPRVIRPVRRPRPERLAVAHDELVVHQVGDARDRLRRHAKRRDQLGVRLRRRRHRDRVRVVDVVDDPHRHAAAVRLP
jgi:hypothetical protein